MRRPLIINGFMATGKSATARALARMTGRPALDLDTEIERRAGKSVAQIFADSGEPSFRQLERELLREFLERGAPEILAVGGGALLARDVRLHALERAVVVTLSVDDEVLLARLGRSPGARPLLADPASNVEQLRLLRELREKAYAEAHEQLDTTELTPDEAATRVLGVWERDPIGVAAGLSSYSVEVGHDFAARRVEQELDGVPLGFLITDTTVDDLYGASIRDALRRAGARDATFRLTPGEEHKNPQSLVQIWEAALAAEADRKSCFLGLGGGVATDVAGFAAATWMRGVPWLSLPTTLLGMVDASVGGKTAVDLPEAKNCVGAFWQPQRVLCDIAHLVSESARGFRSALAEVVKTALLGDAALFETLEARRDDVRRRDPELVELLVRRCIQVKARVVSHDEREQGIRAALNLGHTVGHALEAYGGYGELTHGEAVSLGLVAALRIGERLGVGDAALTERATALLSSFGLPVDLARVPLKAATSLIANDKKRGGSNVRFVLTSRPGSFELRTLPLAEVQSLAAALA